MICSCAPMFKFFCTPPDGATTEYQISNREFSDFLRTYYCDFLSNVQRQARFFFCCDNGQCDAYPAGIALPQKRHCFCFQFNTFLVSDSPYNKFIFFIFNQSIETHLLIAYASESDDNFIISGVWTVLSCINFVSYIASRQFVR